MPPERIAIYAGTFDPLTLGHLDIIERAAKLFDRLVVAVAASEGKRPMFPLDERVARARAASLHLPGVTVRELTGLLVAFAREHGAATLVRGLREAGDLDIEMQMAAMNRAQDAGIDTIFLPASPAVRHITGTLVRQISKSGGDTRPFVPAAREG